MFHSVGLSDLSFPMTAAKRSDIAEQVELRPAVRNMQFANACPHASWLI
jgi:hypothetical protein